MPPVFDPGVPYGSYLVCADEGTTSGKRRRNIAVTGLLGVAAFASVNGDLPFSRDSKDRKLAYAAAEAGLNYYLFQLNRDFDYWSRCASAPPPNANEASPINQRWDGAGTDPRVFARCRAATASTRSS